MVSPFGIDSMRSAKQNSLLSGSFWIFAKFGVERLCLDHKIIMFFPYILDSVIELIGSFKYFSKYCFTKFC